MRFSFLLLFAFLHFRTALSNFVPGVLLINQVNSSSATDDLASLGTSFHGTDRTTTLHSEFSTRSSGAGGETSCLGDVWLRSNGGKGGDIANHQRGDDKEKRLHLSVP